DDVDVGRRDGMADVYMRQCNSRPGVVVVERLVGGVEVKHFACGERGISARAELRSTETVRRRQSTERRTEQLDDIGARSEVDDVIAEATAAIARRCVEEDIHSTAASHRVL